MTRSISILGATGSIGASTLDLVRRNREQWRVVALTANADTERTEIAAAKIDLAAIYTNEFVKKANATYPKG